MESWKYLKNTNLELRIYWHCEDDSCSQLSVFLQRRASSSKMLSKFKQTKARSHEESRRLICAACGCKDFRAHPVTEAIQSLIKVEVCSHYDRADENVPSGICSSCRTNLFIAKKDNPIPTTVRARWNSMDYSVFRPPSQSATCQCLMCKVVRYRTPNVEAEAQPDMPRQKTQNSAAEKENQARNVENESIAHVILSVCVCV